MELLEPRHKKNCRLAPNSPLPLICNKDGKIKKIRAIFNGFSVVIDEFEDMKNVVSMGYFGKANFSRSYPQWDEKNPEILRKRQFDKRKLLSEKCQSKVPSTVIVVPDSEDETEDYFTNLNPKYEIDRSGIRERVLLTMEETFFLAHAVDCLVVYYGKHLLEVSEMWDLFSKTNPFFVYNYIAYFHFRARNWVVKPGIKFGGDYLLYRQGPPFFHASYVIIIDILDNKLQRLDLPRRSLDNVSILALNRLCEASGKELLICQLILPDETIRFNNLNSVVVKEILIRRWISQENV